MSKQNKVNPGNYTQAGRLSQDDAAREAKKQREHASPRNTEAGDFGDKPNPRVTDEDKSEDEDANEDTKDERED